ncbi:MAG: hypothetical protein C0507_01460 [Cyanobacteria bacterium PR.3.49]|nr:hypothetical protein [Cyanobacteria bacterium PR.3.49]
MGREIELKKKYARSSMTLTKEKSLFKAHETKITRKAGQFCFLATGLRKLAHHAWWHCENSSRSAREVLVQFANTSRALQKNERASILSELR